MNEPYYQADRVVLYLGDCVEVMASMPEASVDAVVCDPPYGLEFMGKDWDAPWKQAGDVIDDPAEVGGFQDGAGGNPYSRARIRYGIGSSFQAWCETWAREAYRVLNPGGYLLAFGGTRTYHRLASGVEDAGLEVRDTLAWMYGSGFPKSKDIERAIAMDACCAPGRHFMRAIPREEGKRQPGDHVCPETPESVEWRGWGTALKPAYEPIVMARKPLSGKVAANVQRWGTGAINIDGTRIEGEPWQAHRATGLASVKFFTDGDAPEIDKAPHAGGRWPANVILGCACDGPGHDAECAVALLDAQAGERVSGGGIRNGAKEAGVFGAYAGDDPPREFPANTGGASRFFHIARWTAEDDFGVEVVRRIFYTAKASRSEREAGLEELPPALRTDGREAGGVGGGGDNPRLRVSQRHNDHPTVKPIAVMRWLVTMVTPPGGLVLDPFLGSGTTVLAALDVPGIRAIGIDMTERYVEIARYRIDHRHILDERIREPSPVVPQGRLI